MKLGLFSISYAGLWGQDRLDLEEFIARAARLGYGAVMMAGKRPHLSPLDCSDERLARLRDVLATHRIECAVLAAYTDLAGGEAAEVPYQEMQIAYVESLGRIAAALGTRIIRVFTAYEHAGKPSGPLWRQVVESLREMSDRIKDRGITLAVQNHHDLAVHTNSLLDLVAEVGRPNCRLGFDAWSPGLRGEVLYESAKKAAPLTVMTTNADYALVPRYRYLPDLVNYERLMPDQVRAVRFGDGFLDLDGFFRGLRDGGFDGLATYEMCSPIRGGGSLENLDAYAAYYVQWMRERGFAASSR